jgi:formylglycine-generating enzyme required for sulfatase activity
MKRLLVAAILAVGMSVAPARADWFGTGENRFEIPFVTIGSPGNAADTTGDPKPAGRVDYTYRIGKYEVPEEAVRKANAQSALDDAPLGITLDTRGSQKPATSLSWFEAAQFVNWLNEDVGASPAYKFDAAGAFQLWEAGDTGYNAANPFRNSHALYVLPSVDEWYKAAYYDPVADVWWDYPTGSNDRPTPVTSGNLPGTAVWNQTTGPADVQLAGGESPFGTVGQGGNVHEWQEGPVDAIVIAPGPNVRGFRGGAWNLAASASGLSSLSAGDISASGEPAQLSFRVLSVPEPVSAAYVLALQFVLLVSDRRDNL